MIFGMPSQYSGADGDAEADALPLALALSEDVALGLADPLRLVLGETEVLGETLTDTDGLALALRL
jgi:hypothetical protein